MKIKIAIIENEVIHMDHLSTLITQWSKETDTEIEVETYTSGESFFNEHNLEYHLLFLDIELGNMNGTTLAHRLREKGYCGELVFTTSHQEYVFEGYDVHALNFLLKPLRYEKVANVMNFVRDTTKKNYFYFQTPQKQFQILYHDIIAFTSWKHYIEIMTTSKEEKDNETIRISLKNLLPLLPPEFIQCHRTSVINIHHIQKITLDTIYLTNQVNLPISKTYFKNVQNAFLTLIKEN